MRKSAAIVLLCTTVLIGGCGRTTGASEAPSAGITQSRAAPCTPAKPATTGSTTEKLRVNGAARDYSINIPPGYDGQTALPLVMSFHGRGSSSMQQVLLTGLDAVSDQEDFILVTPDALDGNWDLPRTPSQTTTDTTYVAELVAALAQRLCVDTTRLYASGMSLGSAMTFALACAPKQTFAAYGGVGASFYRPACSAAPPAPIIYFHGTADAIVPFEGGKVSGSAPGSVTARVNAVDANMAAWAKHDGCPDQPAVTEIADTTLTVWAGCTNNVAVDYYRVNGGGHTWPGANQLVADYTESTLGKTTQAVDASELMWAFFSQYQLQQ